MELKIDPTKPEEVSAALRMLEAMRSGAIAINPEVKNGAAIFQTAPLPAPGTAAAEVFGTAPVVLPGSLTAPTAQTMLAPPPAPSAVAPPAPAASLAPASGVELDSKGMPWDDRIHASTRTKISDGSWKAKRGVEPALLAAVTAELTGGAPLPPVAPLAVAPASDGPATFEQIMPRLTQACLSGVLDAAAIGAACATAGLASVVALQSHPDAIPAVWAELKRNYPALA